MTNAIGQWNPAWGPEPQRQSQRPSGKPVWYRITCACTAEAYVVHSPANRFICARCGAEMTLARIVDGRKRKREPNIAVGERYGRLEVVEVGSTGAQGRRVTCRCDCGEVKGFWAKHLKSGRTKSCGCLRAEGPRSRPWVDRW